MRVRARSSAVLKHPVVAPVGVAVLAVALLAVVGFVAVRDADRTVRSDASARVRSNRDAAVRALLHQSDDYKQTVAAWSSTAPVIDSLANPTTTSLAAAQAQLSTLARSKDAPAAFLSDLRGRSVVFYPSQPELIGKDFAFRDWFRGTASTGAPYVSEGYRSAAAGRPLVVAISAPVVDGSTRVGYVSVLWQLDSVRALSQGSQHDDGVTITVTDQRGQQLIDTLAVDDRGQGQAVPISATTKAALAGTSLSLVSGDSFVAAGPVSGLGWTVTAALPTAVARAPARRFARNLLNTLGVALFLILLFTTLAIRLARRRAAEQSVADDERRRLATLFAASPIGIIEALPDGTVVAVNDALGRMLGFGASELLEMTTRDLVHPESAKDAARNLQEVLDGGVNGYTSERLYRARDGSAVPTLESAVAIRGRDGSLRRIVGFVVDQREQKSAADALKSLADALAGREAFLSTLFETVDVAVLACDVDGVSTLINHHGRAIPGLSEKESPDSHGVVRLAHLDGRPMHRSDTPLIRALTEGDVRDVELQILTENAAAPVRLLAHARRLTDARGETIGAVQVAHDVTAIRATETALRASEDRFRRVFDEGLTGKLLVDTRGDIIDVNATFAHLVGREHHQLVGQSLDSCFDDADDELRIRELVQLGVGELRAEMAMRDAAGRSLWGFVALSWITEHTGQRVLLAQVEDITSRRYAEHRLTELALHDELTGLPNRRLLLEHCRHAFSVAKAGRAGSTSVSALFIDLDGFKPINDRAGHETGDQLLKAIARDLESTLRGPDTVARVGGDEFVVLVEGDEGLDYLRALADRVTSVIRRQVSTETASLIVSASVGIARVDLADEPDVTPDQLLRRADAAMYRAKERGRDRHDVFDAELRDRTEARQVLERAMRDGLRDDRVSLVFQPVVEVDSGTVVGAEALLRLSAADGRLLPTFPSVIAAEAAGLAEAVGDRVLNLALDAAGRWPAHMSLAVNVSSRELTGRELRARIERALRRHDFDPARLVLEITESSILSAGPSALVELEKLRQQGIRVAIDDFGTAYATLQNLTTLPVDALKVDSSFTAGLPHQRTHTAVVHGVASMARELGIPCIIEGVETQVQLAAIRGMAVQAQGWIWGTPQGPEHIPTITALQRPRTEPVATGH